MLQAIVERQHQISRFVGVAESRSEAIERYGLGASGSPILSGPFDVHEQFAEELARFFVTGADGVPMRRVNFSGAMVFGADMDSALVLV